MTGAWPDLSGRLVDGAHILPVRIYYEDTDFSGVVYHGSYVRFMERGRTDFLRLLGVGHEALAKGEHAGEPLAFAVRKMAIEFLKPARIDDLVEVETRLDRIDGARIVLVQTIRRGSVTLVTAEVVVVMINAAGQPRRLPAAVIGGLGGGGGFTDR
jgi:acyl-CoA thioester hydrolase